MNQDDDMNPDFYLKHIDNFGPAKDMFYPEYGWVLKDGKLTPEGEKFFADQRDRNGRKR